MYVEDAMIASIEEKSMWVGLMNKRHDYSISRNTRAKAPQENPKIAATMIHPILVEQSFPVESTNDSTEHESNASNENPPTNNRRKERPCNSPFTPVE